MTNGMLLKIAAGLCAATMLLALSGSWSLISARSRWAAAETELREVQQTIQATRATLEKERADHELAEKQLSDRVKKLEDDLRPPPKAKADK